MESIAVFLVVLAVAWPLERLLTAAPFRIRLVKREAPK